MNAAYLAQLFEAQPLLLELAVAVVALCVLAGAVQVCVSFRLVRAPRTASLLWLTVLVAPVVVLVPVTSLAVVSLPAPEHPAAGLYTTVIEDVAVSSSAGRQTTTVMEGSSRGDTGVAPFANTLLLLWLAGVAWLCARRGVAWFHLERVIRTGAHGRPELCAARSRIAGECGLRKSPGLVIADVDTPCLARVWRPVILLPRWLGTQHGVSGSLQWIMRHECMHVLLGDPWANAARHVAETVFWFHPLARWAGRKWEAAAERACDAALIDTPAAARDYAQTLYGLLERLSQRRGPHHAFTLGASRTQVAERIRALLSQQDFRTRPHRLPVLAGISAALVIAAVVGVRYESPTAEAKAEEPKWDLRLGNAVLETTDDASVWHLRAKGDFRFAPERRGLEALSDDAFMRLAERGPEMSIRLDIEAEENGAPKYAYRVNGRRALFDDAAREWMSRTLDKVELK